jgi:HTH-type transcriptional regulator/antitoxin HigA
MIDRGWLKVDNLRDVRKIEGELARFFDVESVESIEILPHAARKTNTTTPVSAAQLAWIYRVRQLAKRMVVPKYSRPALLQAIEDLKRLLRSAEEARNAPRILAEAGIRFVIVESLRSANIDGVCLWLNDEMPVVGMTLRFDRIDNFWFVLRHELEHVLRGHGRHQILLDIDLEGERASTSTTVSEDERSANFAASDFCVPSDAMEQFIARKAPVFAERDVLGFANTMQLHPGLVAGQLQHRANRYEILRKHLTKVRSIVSPGAIVDGWGDIATA